MTAIHNYVNSLASVSGYLHYAHVTEDTLVGRTQIYHVSQCIMVLKHVVQNVMFVLRMWQCIVNISPSLAALSFVPLNLYISVPEGDDPSGIAVVPDVTFRFGTTTINSIYVRIVMKG